MVGILLGSEWNSTKKKVEYRRWVVVQLASNNDGAWQPCLLPLMQVAQWPEGRAQESAAAALPVLSSSGRDTVLHNSACAKKPGSYNSHLVNARKQRWLQRARADSEVLLDRTRGGQHSASPASAMSAESPAPARSAARGGETGADGSGIKHGLDGIGEKKINEFSESQLLLALEEHGLPAPLPSERDKSLYAKRLLFLK